MTEWARNQIRPTSRLFLLLRTLALGFIMAPGGRGRRSPHLATPRKDGLAGEMGEGTMTVLRPREGEDWQVGGWEGLKPSVPVF